MSSSRKASVQKRQVAECCVRFLSEEFVGTLLQDVEAASLAAPANALLAVANAGGEDAGVGGNDVAVAERAAAAAVAAAAAAQDAEDAEDAVLQKLESCGYEIGYRLVERCLLSRSSTKRISDLTSVLKFVCKDFWSAAFSKQVSKLQTNHRGTFVLTDAEFQWVRNVSASGEDGVSRAKDEARKLLFLPCGMVRGALANLGLDCTVAADVVDLPLCTFTIVVK